MQNWFKKKLIGRLSKEKNKWTVSFLLVSFQTLFLNFVLKATSKFLLNCHRSISFLFLCFCLIFSSVQTIAGFRNNYHLSGSQETASSMYSRKQEPTLTLIFSSSQIIFNHKQIYRKYCTDLKKDLQKLFISWHYLFNTCRSAAVPGALSSVPKVLTRPN